MQRDAVNNCNLEPCMEREKILINFIFNSSKKHVMHDAITTMQR